MGGGKVMLEDKHCQIILKNEDEDTNKILMDFDLILRTNDERTQYEYFDVYDYKNNQMVASGIEIKK
jgi:hypothetical protein